MSFEAIAALAAVILGYALVSGRLAGWSVSGPLVFVMAGIVLGPSALGIVGGDFDEGGVELLAKATLILSLFVDATRIDLRVLRKELAIPARMLGVGLPLTVITGAMIGAVVLSGLTVLEAALVAAILAPTDAALSQAVVSDKGVPVRIRQGLNVESGLNDGLMLPVIAILTAFAVSNSGLESTNHWVEFVSRQVGFGVLFGVAFCAAGGVSSDYFVKRGVDEGGLARSGVFGVGFGVFAGALNRGGKHG